MGKFVDLTGRRFGRLTVICRVTVPNKSGTYWDCKCDCGNHTTVKTGNLNKEHRGVRSCGCLYNETHKKDELNQSRIHKIYHQMKYRCYNPNSTDYKYYGGIGITICDEWLDKETGFRSFYEWSIANGYSDNLTIDRRNVEKGYSPNNCRWVTMKEQSNNRKSNHAVTYNGKTQSIMKWSDDTGISYSALKYRIRNNWTVEKALTTPTRK